MEKNQPVKLPKDKKEKAQKTKFDTFLRWVNIIGFISSGLFVSMFIAFSWSFCMKDCSGQSYLQANSQYWMPLASLLFTVPIARRWIK